MQDMWLKSKGINAVARDDPRSWSSPMISGERANCEHALGAERLVVETVKVYR